MPFVPKLKIAQKLPVVVAGAALIASAIVGVLSYSIGAGTVATPVTLAANTCNVSSADSVASYFGEAHPVTPGSTGGRAFGTDQRGTIFQDPTGGGSVPFTAATVWTATTPLQ